MSLRDTMATRELVDREQVPAALRRLDDPWGITWRLTNAVRRFSFAWTLRFLRAWVAQTRHLRPVFLVGVPRSGTSLLFYLLRESSELGSLPGEGDTRNDA